MAIPPQPCPGELVFDGADLKASNNVMANELEIFEFLEAEYEYNTEKKKRRKELREKCNPFDLDEVDFIKRFRLSKELAYNLCEELRPLLKKPIKHMDLSVETKVLTALSFYATGSYQRPIGNLEGIFIAQQTVSSVLAEVTMCLNTPQIRQKYIHFPNNDQERNEIKAEFYKKIKIPGVLGCIDCTHVAIVRPVHNEERYFSRKHYHSLNVQLVCDVNMQILSVDASYGGANHDSFIWSNHPLKAHMEELSNSQNIWLLGDSGYSLRKTMMTPMVNTAPDTPEAHYTNLHVRARNVVERAIGLLKARFRCLLVHRVLHYSPEVAGSIVNACVILHNICNKANTPVPQLSDEEQTEEVQLQLHYASADHPRSSSSSSSNVALQQGWSMRNALIQLLWERRHL
ncbi:putative nuclease HARBI1 [Aphomia sociella]